MWSVFMQSEHDQGETVGKKFATHLDATNKKPSVEINIVPKDYKKLYLRAKAAMKRQYDQMKADRKRDDNIHRIEVYEKDQKIIKQQKMIKLLKRENEELKKQLKKQK